MFDYLDDLATDLWLSSEDAIVSQFIPAFDPWEQDSDYEHSDYYAD